MSFKTLDTVVLTTDLPCLGLRRGDVGAVVQVYSTDAVEVRSGLLDLAISWQFGSWMRSNK